MGVAVHSNRAGHEQILYPEGDTAAALDPESLSFMSSAPEQGQLPVGGRPSSYTRVAPCCRQWTAALSQNQAAVRRAKSVKGGCQKPARPHQLCTRVYRGNMRAKPFLGRPRYVDLGPLHIKTIIYPSPHTELCFTTGLKLCGGTVRLGGQKQTPQSGVQLGQNRAQDGAGLAHSPWGVGAEKGASGPGSSYTPIQSAHRPLVAELESFYFPQEPHLCPTVRYRLIYSPGCTVGFIFLRNGLISNIFILPLNKWIWYSLSNKRSSHTISSPSSVSRYNCLINYNISR